MKKITFILLAFLSINALAQESTGTTQVNAHIVEVIDVEAVTPLNFGNMVASTGGKVRVNVEGNRSFSNTNMEILNAGTVSAAEFNVNAAQNFSYSVSIPGIQLTPVDTDSENTPMDVSFFWDINGTTSGLVTGTGENQTLIVGGLLDVASGQGSGDYQGTVEVTVSYE